MGPPVYHLVEQAKREAINEVKQQLIQALIDVAPTCSSSTSIGDALRRVAEKLKE